ncbi:cation-translocating P-type ATPase [Magnetospirillum sp. UT-4]|uniref:heavy metal translocating P-type ATPase n=1 Tax=Magnetospirillum sp. UT-4 TaxID=2681467 RepID=UPI0013825796|nr:heavy metal translocating P-type ATPase [Magnetospirillum sp. UT-4]CAA7622378.1 putative cadmium-transporting ATPase [Magnetospirillum sp. UT-4]
MCCAAEIPVLRAAIEPLMPAGQEPAFDLLAGKMTVPASISPDVVVAAIGKTGMKAEPWEAATATDRDRAAQAHRRRQAAMAALSAAATVAALALDQAPGLAAAARGAELVAVTIGLWMVLPKAAYALRALRPDMNLLMTIAVLCALIMGDWMEAASVSALFALSLSLEAWSTERARRGIAALLDLAPTQARVKRPHDTEEVLPPDMVAVGEICIVLAGERIPLDGRIVAGESLINQAPITGESLPVPKGPGGEVFAGTINTEGAIEIETLKPASDSTLSKVVRMVEAAQGRKSKVERWIDRFAAIYTPIVLAVAVAVAVLPPLLLGRGWQEGIFQALVLLVISCPCALVISTPLTVVAAMASAARAGILVKGGEHLEVASRLTAVAFDKTGTITLGRPEVETVVALDGSDGASVLAVAAALESRGTHPLGRAIVEHALTQGVDFAPAEAVQAMPGKGLRGQVAGRAAWLGSVRHLADQGGGVPPALASLARELAEGGRSVVAVGDERGPLGVIALSDPVRPQAGAALAALRRAGIAHQAMLTGDNAATARRVASSLSIDTVHAELLPDEKSQAIETLLDRFGTVAMVGDGINDAPAMARSSLGIAMGVAGSDTAIEAADVALMADDLGCLAWLVGHSRRMMRIIRQNIGFAIAVKAVFAVLAFADLATLWGAIAADTGAALLVALNGLRMLRGPASAPRPMT